MGRGWILCLKWQRRNGIAEPRSDGEGELFTNKLFFYVSSGGGGTELRSRAAGGAMERGSYLQINYFFMSRAAKQRRNGIAEPRSRRSDGEEEHIYK